jgi:hypothetical protein
MNYRFSAGSMRVLIMAGWMAWSQPLWAQQIAAK